MIDRLRELLRAATPETKGRWVYRRCDFGQGPVDDYSYVEWGDHVEGYGTAALSVPMARYLAALSPKAVAELLDAHDRMAGALRRSVEAAHDFALMDADRGFDHSATPWMACPAELCETARAALGEVAP